ncbi:MAG TPA: carboxypeptidase-like regulatory domain-containing protein [Candidatus Sulfotelmatobacter sp.]
MLTKKALLLGGCSFLVSFLCPLLYGQATGSFSGTVSDKAGAVVSGATVKATSQGTGVSREAKTDDSGHYLIPLLPVAIYTIRVDAQGFGPAEEKDVRLQIDEHRELDFTVTPASVTTAVEVNATEVAVQTTNPTLGQVITSEQVAELPLNGRDFVQLATLTPGVTQETNPNSFFNGGPSSEVSARGTFSLSVGGSRAQSTDWLLDGNDNNELTAGGIAILPSIDAIQEFKVLTYNYSAEYGTRAGPTVLVTTKSGSNEFHGSLFEFFRNTKLDAKSYFASSKEQFNLNQFGGALGGPIKKDKTFFFLDYQAKRQRHGIPFTGLIPTQAMMQGDYSHDPFGNLNALQLINPYGNSPFICNTVGSALVPVNPNPDGTQTATGSTVKCDLIPSPTTNPSGLSLIDPAGQALINLYPVSNASNAALGYNFTNVPVRKLNEGEFDIRLDHNFSSKDSVFARFSYDQAVSFVPGGSPGFAEQGAFASTQNITNHGRNVAVSETHLFSDNTINQFNAGFNRIFNHILSFGTGTCEAAKIGIQGADLGSQCDSVTGYPASLNQATKDCVGCGLSSTQLTGYWSVGDRGFSPFQGGTNVYSVSDTLDMIRGKHNIRAGGGIRANQMNVLTNGFGDGYFLVFGSYTGDATADLLLGQLGGSIHDQTFLGATTGRRWKMFRPFVQDDWRVTNNLTLNLGVAWSLTTPITEAEGRQANFNFTTGQYLIAGRAPGITGCTNCVRTGGNVGIVFDKTAFEPRIGIAWKPMGSQNTAIRAGYAVFHDSAWSQGAQGTWQNPPYYAEVDNFNNFPGSPCPFGNAKSATPINCGLALSFLQSNLQPILAPPNPDSFTGTIQSQNLNFKQGMVQQFNLNIEHQLPGEIVLTAGYAGSRSTHILVDGLNENIGSPTACAGGPAAVPGYTLGCGPGGAYFAAPYGPFTAIDNNSDNGRARYDSLQVKAEKNARHGLYALLSYTYSRTFDSGFPDGLGTLPGAMYWPLPGAQKADWGLSQINLNNQFTASVLYDLPFGKGRHFGSGWNGAINAVAGNWKVNVIEKAISGFPLFVVDSNNQSGVNFMWNGNVLNRPNEVGDPNKGGPEGGNTSCPSQVHTLANWFNPCAFAAPLPGELGDAPRSPVYGPRFVNTDFSAIKDFPLPFRESMNLQFRAEFFNLFNHTHFFLPGTSAAAMQDFASPSSFGVVNTTLNDPRFIQFALKLIF